jgi:prevent-host-death family protein
MDTVTANSAKQNFGALIDRAQRQAVKITKHGRPSVVVTSDSEYRELMAYKYAHLRAEVQAGFAELDAGEFSPRSAKEIAAAVKAKHQPA